MVEFLLLEIAIFFGLRYCPGLWRNGVAALGLRTDWRTVREDEDAGWLCQINLRTGERRVIDMETGRPSKWAHPFLMMTE